MNHLPSFTPFPNALFEVMPTLKDTEWRVLCVVVRQTLGWRDGEGRGAKRESVESPDNRPADSQRVSEEGKPSSPRPPADGRRGQRRESQWIAHRRFKELTGRDSEAISGAIDALVCRGLIEIWDDTGQRLTTPASRRRCRGRLLFRLTATVLTPATSESEEQLPKTEVTFSESEIRKAKTIKETQIKDTPYGGERDTTRSPSEGKNSSHRKPSPEPPNPDVKRFLYAYIALFKRHTASGDPPPIFWGKDGKLIKQLLKVYSYDRLLDLLQQFFNSDDEWMRKLGYSLGAFKAAIPKLLVEEKQMTVIERRDPVTGQWVKVREERA